MAVRARVGRWKAKGGTTRTTRGRSNPVGAIRGRATWDRTAWVGTAKSRSAAGWTVPPGFVGRGRRERLGSTTVGSTEVGAANGGAARIGAAKGGAARSGEARGGESRV